MIRNQIFHNKQKLIYILVKLLSQIRNKLYKQLNFIKINHQYKSLTLQSQIMQKSFEKDILEQYFKQNVKVDPYVFVTPQVNEFIQNTNTIITTKFIGRYLMINFLLAPLQTMITSLQLSVQKNKDLFVSQQSKTKQLAKLNTSMTVHQKRKFQLMIRAGGKTIPYTAPVYNGYKQTFMGLKSQGLMGFYKGLMFRTITSGLFFVPFTQNSILISQEDIQKGIFYQNLKLFGLCMLFDLVANPLYMIQYRMILQNRIPQFRSFKTPTKSLWRMSKYGEAYRGLTFHILNNTVGFFTRFPFYLSCIAQHKLNLMYYGLFLAGQLVTYPFSTVYKRLQCQTQRYTGMIPVRYSGFFHALKVTAYQQGAKGLWRAFPLHAAQTVIRLALLQIFSGSSLTNKS